MLESTTANSKSYFEIIWQLVKSSPTGPWSIFNNYLLAGKAESHIVTYSGLYPKLMATGVLGYYYLAFDRPDLPRQQLEERANRIRWEIKTLRVPKRVQKISPPDQPEKTEVVAKILAALKLVPVALLTFGDIFDRQKKDPPIAIWHINTMSTGRALGLFQDYLNTP